MKYPDLTQKRHDTVSKNKGLNCSRETATTHTDGLANGLICWEFSQIQNSMGKVDRYC